MQFRFAAAFVLLSLVGGYAQCEPPRVVPRSDMGLQPPDVHAPPVVAPQPVTTTDPQPAPVPFAIDVRDDRFPITTETVNGEPVRCVRLPVNDKLRLKASGAADKSVTWRIHPPNRNFDSFECGAVADLTLPPLVNAVVVAATMADDGQTAVVDTLLVVSTQGPQPPPVVVDPSVPPIVPPVVVDPTVKVTTATYVYEKDDTAVPSAVNAALNRLNRERKIIATLFEQNTFDGDDEIPDQYKAALSAAKEAGLPALVVLAGSTVVKIVKDPRTETAVWEAVP